MDHLARMQTLPLLPHTVTIIFGHIKNVAKEQIARDFYSVIVEDYHKDFENAKAGPF